MNCDNKCDGATLGARLRAARLAAGLTQAELARHAGVSTQAINQLEVGRSQTMKAGTAHAVQKATGYRSLWILEGKGPQTVRDADMSPSAAALLRSIEERIDGMSDAEVDKLTRFVDSVLNLALTERKRDPTD